MQWLEVSVSLHREALEAATEIMLRYGSSGVEIDDPRLMLERQSAVGDWDYVELPPGFDPEAEVVLRAWFLQDATTLDTLRAIEDAIKRLPEFGLEIGSAVLATDIIAEENWAEAWKSYFKPLAVGNHLLIKPAWEKYDDDDKVVIEVDPGLAFGTGTHATTRMSLVLLERYLQPGQEVIDVGCGSGILAIAAAKLGAGRVEAIDIDPLAVESTVTNLERNGLCGRVQVHRADLLQYSTAYAELILANIVADVILRLLWDISRVLKPGGILIASGIIADRLDDVLAAIKEHGFASIEVLREDDWVAVAARFSI